MPPSIAESEPHIVPKRRTRAFLANSWRAMRAAWLILGIALLGLIALELILRGFLALKDTNAGLRRVDPRLIAQGYGGTDWVETHFQEYDRLIADWHPYVNYRLRPFVGKTINVLPGGMRKTWNAQASGRTSPPRIWLLGGSAAWGIGARDDFTIPSLLSKELTERGHVVEVINFAEIGYVSMQEYLWLVLKLGERPRPDLVIALDGANDILSAYQNGVAGWPQNEEKRKRAFEAERSATGMVFAALQRLAADSAIARLANALRTRIGGTILPNPVSGTSIDDLANSIVDSCLENHRLLGDLGRARGFDTMCYWQPSLFTKQVPSPFESDELRRYASLAPLFSLVTSRIRSGVSREGDLVGVRDLSRLFDEEPATMFSDFCHLTEAANAILAQRMADDVVRRLESRNPSRHQSK